jgi:hypothetical protein
MNTLLGRVNQKMYQLQGLVESRGGSLAAHVNHDGSITYVLAIWNRLESSRRYDDIVRAWGSWCDERGELPF